MQPARRGYTLMEIILVLVVLVIISAVAIPAVTGMLQGSNLDAATDTVTTQLTKTHNKAVEERRAYKFAIKPGTGSWRIAPDSDEFWGGSGDGGSSGDAGGSALENVVTEGSLPEKVCFSQPNGVSNSSGSSDWSTVATFLADGSAMDDAQLQLSLEGFSPKMIQVNAGTGSVTSATSPGVNKPN